MAAKHHDRRSDTFTLEISGTGVVNDVEFEARGSGTGNSSTGRLQFAVEYSAIAEDTDPFAHLLGVLILETTVFGREIGNAQSLLTLADGVFEFTQEVMGDGIEVGSHGSVVHGDDEQSFRWTSISEGRVELRDVQRIEPFEAVMLPQGPGKMLDVLELPLVAGDSTHRVHIVRHFSFSPRAELPGIQLRRISVEPTIDGRRVGVDIHADMRDVPDRVPGRRRKR